VTGLLITFPWNGFDYNAATTVLTIDPSKALATCRLTAIVTNIRDPTITLSQDYTFNVAGGIPVVLLQ
jgi:hypothetical protein